MDRASNPIKIARDKLKARGIEVVALNPAGSGAIADERTGIIIERWLCFAEGEHVGMLHCGAGVA